jgi:hypothetical protein
MAVPDILELICGHLELEMKPKEHGWIGLLKGVEEKGPPWAEIAEHLPGRTK